MGKLAWHTETSFSLSTYSLVGSKKRISAKGKRHIASWVLVADFFLFFQRCQKQTQSTPRQQQSAHSGPSGPERRRTAQSSPERLLSGFRIQAETRLSRRPLLEGPKTALPQMEKRHISVWFWAAIFSVFQRCQRQTQSTPREAHQMPADRHSGPERPERPRACPGRPRGSQSEQERARAPLSAQEPRVDF